MMRKSHPKLSVSITAGFYLYCALLFFLLPLQWVLALGLSVAVHELGHVAALRMMKIPVCGVQIRPFGVRLHTPAMGAKRELLCAAAGPLFGLSLAFLAKWLPAVALLGCFHSLYNLLPVYPGDGGRICSSLCSLLFSAERSRKIAKAVGILSAALLAAIGLYGTFILKLGLFPCLLGLGITVNTFRNCK